MAPQPLKELPLFSIEDVKFIYRTNFAGEERPPYDDAGDRYFNAGIPDEETAQRMLADGWNVKWTSPSKTATPEVIAEFVPEPFIVVHLGFKFRAPQIILIRDGKPSVITEKNTSLLDSTDFEGVDIVVRARRHEMNGGGYKAWLAEFYGTVKLSDMGKKYAWLLDVQDSSNDDSPGLDD
jgi:hypothetical protein